MAEMRHAVIDSSAPDLAAALGGSVRVLIPLSLILGVLRARAVGLQPGVAAESRSTSDVTTELEQLRARVDQLERELAERTAKAEAAVAAAQERSYWADRLPFDLNRVMPTPIGRAVFLVLLGTVRTLQALKRQALRRLS